MKAWSGYHKQTRRKLYVYADTEYQATLEMIRQTWFYGYPVEIDEIKHIPYLDDTEGLTTEEIMLIAVENGESFTLDGVEYTNANKEQLIEFLYI